GLRVLQQARDAAIERVRDEQRTEDVHRLRVLLLAQEHLRLPDQRALDVGAVRDALDLDEPARAQLVHRAQEPRLAEAEHEPRLAEARRLEREAMHRRRDRAERAGLLI